MLWVDLNFLKAWCPIKSLTIFGYAIAVLKPQCVYNISQYLLNRYVQGLSPCLFYRQFLQRIVKKSLFLERVNPSHRHIPSLLQLTYSSSKLSKWSLASSQSASAPVMTTKSGFESWGRGNLISTLNWSMILRMVRPRVPMSRECTRLSTSTSTRAWPLCDSNKPDVTTQANL